MLLERINSEAKQIARGIKLDDKIELQPKIQHL